MLRSFLFDEPRKIRGLGMCSMATQCKVKYPLRTKNSLKDDYMQVFV